MRLSHFLFLVQATVLEEMPPFPERESSILAKLKKKKPDAELEGGELRPSQASKIPAAQITSQPAVPALPSQEKEEKKAPEVTLMLLYYYYYYYSNMAHYSSCLQ